MKRIKFVTQSKEGFLKIPARFVENLEGLDLLVIIEPVVVEDLAPEMNPNPKEVEIYDEMLGEEEEEQIKQGREGRFMKFDSPQKYIDYLKVDDSNDYNKYLDNARQRLTTQEIKPYTASEIKKRPQYIKEIIIKRLDSPKYKISLNGYIDGHLILGQPVKDKYELKIALSELQYADNFKLTIRSAPLYEELTSIVYHFFTPKYELVNTEAKLDDFIDTYEKNKEKEIPSQKGKSKEEKVKEWKKYKALQQHKEEKYVQYETVKEARTKLPKEEVDKIIAELKEGKLSEKEAYKKLRERAQEEAVLRGELKPTATESGFIYTKPPIQTLDINLVCNKGEVTSVVLSIDGGEKLNEDRFLMVNFEQLFTVLAHKDYANEFKVNLIFENAFDKEGFTDTSLISSINAEVWAFFADRKYSSFIKEAKDIENETGMRYVISHQMKHVDK